MRGVATVAAVAGAIALGACSDGTRSAPQGPPAEAGGVSAAGGRPLIEAQAAYARCLRAHGVDFPDPKPGEGFTLDPGRLPPARLRTAERRCAKERQAIADAAPARGPEDLARDREATLAFARCMRAEGQQVPDPRPASEDRGTAVEVPAGSKEDPAFQAASRRCEHLLREGGR